MRFIGVIKGSFLWLGEYLVDLYISLDLGYVCTQDGRCLPVQEVDLPLWKHGEGGKDPKDFGFRFKADNVWHNIQASM